VVQALKNTVQPGQQTLTLPINASNIFGAPLWERVRANALFRLSASSKHGCEKRFNEENILWRVTG